MNVLFRFEFIEEVRQRELLIFLVVSDEILFKMPCRGNRKVEICN